MKEIPLIKNLIIGFAWFIPPTILPLIIGGVSPSVLTYIIGVLFFSLAFINSMLFDTKDIEGDSIAGVFTIPVLIGYKKTIVLLSTVNLLIGFHILIKSIEVTSISHVIVILIGIIFTQFYILTFKKMSEKKIYCDVIIDGQFIFLGIVLFLIDLIT